MDHPNNVLFLLPTGKHLILTFSLPLLIFLLKLTACHIDSTQQSQYTHIYQNMYFTHASIANIGQINTIQQNKCKYIQLITQPQHTTAKRKTIFFSGCRFACANLHHRLRGCKNQNAHFRFYIFCNVSSAKVNHSQF